MPEIAEIALTAEVLENKIKNKCLIQFEIKSGRYLKKIPEGYYEFTKDLPMIIKNVKSYGKFLWFELTNKNQTIVWYIWNTFGLTGKWLFNEDKNNRIILHFKKNQKIYYNDIRNFGTFKFSKNFLELKKKLIKLSPDFLKDDDFNLSNIKNINLPIVKILMSQNKIGSGLGNYLTAEILYRAAISPHKLGKNMSNNDIKKLTYWIKYIVKLAYMYNTTDYVIDLQNEISQIKKKNYHPDIILKEKKFKFLVYRKKIDPYGNKVKSEKIVGTGKNKRTTYWVPKIQK